MVFSYGAGWGEFWVGDKKCQSDKKEIICLVDIKMRRCYIVVPSKVVKVYD
ncbi:MAG: hypothetical protein AB1422_14565 [bacterium]